MKKLLSLLLALFILLPCLGLVACSGNDTTTTVTAPPSAEADVFVNGAELSSYTVVIPKDCNKITLYAAQNFVFLVKDALGIELTTVTDDTAPVENEILIGETNREESKTDVTLSDGEYLLFTKGKKIVMKGYGIYVGGACGDFVNKHIKPAYNEKTARADVSSVSNQPTPTKFNFADTYNSVIFMIGDGMGNNHIRMAERHMDEPFVGRALPNQGWSVTGSLSVLNGDATFTDSAASATAMSTGYKTLNRRIGMDAKARSLLNVRELAALNGAKTAVITTDVITGATPSAYLCHLADRGDEAALKAQIDALVANGDVNYVKGDIPHQKASPVDSITKELKTALETVSAGGGSFFVMAEEAYIDKYADDGEYLNTINSVKRFDDAAIYAVEFVLCHPDTALIITADHETGGLIDDPTHASQFRFTTHDHTNLCVPVFAIGAGTEIFNAETVDNTDLAKFTAKAYSNQSFGSKTKY